MNALDAIAAEYRANHVTDLVAELQTWEGSSEKLRDFYREDVRMIARLLADAMTRAGYCRVYDAPSAVAFLLEIAAGHQDPG